MVEFYRIVIMEIGSAIKLYRKNVKIKQYELAGMCEISITAMNQIETNVAFPSKNTLIKISKSLNIPLAFILFSCISDEDIPEEKKFTFEFLKSAMNNLLLTIQNEKSHGIHHNNLNLQR